MLPFKNPAVILGIDPGLRRIGYGAIKGARNQFYLCDAGLLVPQSNLKKNAEQRLFVAQQALKQLICQLHPRLFAIEKIYFGRNRNNALAIAELQGVLLSTAQQAKIQTIELSPSEVKKIICGFGNADKRAVRKMLGYQIQLPEKLYSKDAIDAIAIALAGYIKSRATF